MPRPARFTDDDVLDAALAALVEHGPGVTVAQIARALGGPVGSIYHRFGSREDLLAQLWIRCIRRFHEGLLSLGGRDDPRSALVESARYVVRYCAAHPDEALGMRLHRQDRLARDGRVSPGIREGVATINEAVDRLLTELVRGHYGRADEADLRRGMLATRVVPYGLVRPWLGEPLPEGLEEAAVASAEAILDLG